MSFTMRPINPLYLQKIEELFALIDQYSQVILIMDDDQHGGLDLRMLLMERFELIPLDPPNADSLKFEVQKIRYPGLSKKPHKQK